MANALWLLFALPLSAFVLLGLAGRRMTRTAAGVVGTAGPASAALVTLGLLGGYLAHAPRSYTQTLWSWMELPGWHASISLRLDALSLAMCLVVTLIGSAIVVYSTEFMQEDPGLTRFLAYMNLFIASMLLLVLADDFLLLYLGWEGVGLCSYLLIGFWFQDPDNGRAARKAFIVTRIGDVSLLLGILLLATRLGTLRIGVLMQGVALTQPQGSGLPLAAALLVLGGALGKSAQLPLQVWLPDAMAGPTPVSALIHAATMVTAGVYLIARTRVLFVLAPAALELVAILGAVTLVVGALSAIAQHDIKRVLAYSTMSQVGYMFLALGVGAWSAALFHLMVHACFKSLLFLGAGAVIQARGGEHEMARMGGLRRQLPLTFWTFLIGGASLAAVPLVTAGFYSKDLILWFAWSSARGSIWLWGAGLLGSLLTSVYIFRLIFLVFFGPTAGQVEKRPGSRMTVPMLVLAALSLFVGLLQFPHWLGRVALVDAFLSPVLQPAVALHGGAGLELELTAVAAVVSLGGIYLAYLMFLRTRRPRRASPLTAAVGRLCYAGLGFDALYRALLVAPYQVLASQYRSDPIDAAVRGLAALMGAIATGLRRTQTGRVRTYLGALALGAVFLLALVVLR